MKRMMLMLVTAVLCLALSIAAASVEYTDTGYGYEIKQDGTIRVVDYLGKFSRDNPSQHIVIPSEIDGRIVSEIGNGAFSGGYSVYEAVVPGSIHTIGDDAFASSGIYRVILKEGVESIGESAFFMTPLEYIVLPQSLKSIGWGAFMGCENLTDISIPANVQSIQANAFAGCEDLQAIQIPVGIAKISFGMFSDCVNLEKVELHNGVMVIDDDAFENCRSLSEITLPENDELRIGEQAFLGAGIKEIHQKNKKNRYQVIDEVLYDMETMTAMYGLKSEKKQASFLSGTKRIVEGAFMNHPYLEQVVLPQEVTRIEERTFMNCTNLKSIEFPATLKEIGEDAFCGCKVLESLNLPRSLEKIGAGAFSGCFSLQNVLVPGSVKVLAGGVFSECINLKELVLSEGIERIGGLSLYGCESITQIIIPRSVEEIEHIVDSRDIRVYVFRNSAAHKYAEKWNEHYEVIDDIHDIPNDSVQMLDIEGLQSKKWASFTAAEKTQIYIDDTKMYHYKEKGSINTIEEYMIDGDLISSKFFGRANPTMQYKFLSNDMITFLDRTGINYIALLVRVPGRGTSGFAGEWDVYRYRGSYDFLENGKAMETGNIYRDEKEEPYEFDYWIDGDVVQIDDQRRLIEYRCLSQSEDLIRVELRDETGYLIPDTSRRDEWLGYRDEEIAENTRKNTSVNVGEIASFDLIRGIWPKEYRYGVQDAIFRYEDSDLIQGGVVITGVRIDENSVDEYHVQSLVFPTAVDGKTVIGIAEGCCENMLEIGDVVWPEKLRYIGSYAFRGCENLEGISLPVSVVDIGNYAFMGCDLWEGVAVYEHARIGLGAFADTCDATPSGYVFLMDGYGKTTPVHYGEHCPQAIKRDEHDVSSYVKGKLEELGITLEERYGPKGVTAWEPDLTLIMSQQEPKEKKAYGSAVYRDGSVELSVRQLDEGIRVEIEQDSLLDMLPGVKELALETQEEINRNGHADAKPKQDNAQICEAVYRAVRQAMKNMES